MIFLIRKYDLSLYIILTIIATITSVFSIYYVTLKFGKISFSEYAYCAIIMQIIFTFSDLGTKISYFKDKESKSKSNYKYLLASKLFVASLVFILFGLIYGGKIYFSFVFTLIGTMIFPTLILQEYRLFTLIAVNNVLFRVLPLLLLFRFSTIEEFSVFSGIIIIFFSSILFYFLKIFNSFKFNFNEFFLYFRKLVTSNIYLSAINVLSIIEVNIHTFLVKSIFPIADFADFIYIERYVNYIKQTIIYLYEYLYPKVKLSNFALYVRRTRYLSFSYELMFLIFLFLCTYLNIENFYGIEISKLFYIFCLYPLSSLLFNFIISMFFYKYGNDRFNLIIIMISIVLKTILILCFSAVIGIVIVPLVLILMEILVGLIRLRLLPFSIRRQMNFKLL